MQWLRSKGCHVACDEYASGEICSLQHMWVTGSVMGAVASVASLKFGVQGASTANWFSRVNGARDNGIRLYITLVIGNKSWKFYDDTLWWWEYSQKGVTDGGTDGGTDWGTDGRTDGGTDGRTEGRTDGGTDGRTDWTIHRAAWSQLKKNGKKQFDFIFLFFSSIVINKARKINRICYTGYICIHRELECGTWYHHPRRLQCVLSRNLRIFKVATWHYRCRHNLKDNCIWDNLQYCLLVPRSPSKPVMLTFDLQSRKVLFIEIVFWHV